MNFPCLHPDLAAGLAQGVGNTGLSSTLRYGKHLHGQGQEAGCCVLVAVLQSNGGTCIASYGEAQKVSW